MDGLYNHEKALQSSGKEVKAAPADGAEGAAGAAGEGKEGTAGAGAGTEDQLTPEQELAKIAEEQKGMSADEIVADNEKRADAKLTDAERTEKETAAKELKIANEKADKAAEDKAMAKILEKLGVKDLEELAKKIPGKELTPEEKEKNEQQLRANVAQFAVKNGLLTMDDITKYDNMKKQDKKDLVFNDFSKKYSEIHKDRTDAADPTVKVAVTKSEIEDSFNEFFHINSENSALKKTGEELLETYAKNILGDTEGKYNNAVADYEEYEARKNFFPTFKSFVKEVVDEIPAEIVFGEGDKKIVFKTDKLDKEEIAKIYSTNEAFDAFYTQKGDQKVRDTFRKEFQERLVAKNINSLLDVALGVGESIGIAQAKVGAENAFDEKKVTGDNKDVSQKVKVSPEQYRKDQAKHYSGAKTA